MRILVDARPLVEHAHGGVNRVARQLVRAYADAHPDDELLLLTTGLTIPTTQHLPTSPNCRHIHVRIPNKLWSLLCLFGLSSLDRLANAKTGSFDLIFLPNLGFTGRLRCPSVLLIHDISFVIEPRWFRVKMRWWHQAVRAKRLITHATHLLTVSERTRQDVIRFFHINPRLIETIPFGTCFTPATQTHASLPIALKPRIVFVLGQNDPRKNTDTILRAVEILRGEHEFADIHCVAVGKNFHPSDEELAERYATATVFAYPSWYEGYGLPLHEAASFGTPCIASSASALPDTAPKGTIFLDPAKPHHWADMLRHILRHPDRFRTTTTEQSWQSAIEQMRHVFLMKRGQCETPPLFDRHNP